MSYRIPAWSFAARLCPAREDERRLRGCGRLSLVVTGHISTDIYVYVGCQEERKKRKAFRQKAGDALPECGKEVGGGEGDAFNSQPPCI